MKPILCLVAVCVVKALTLENINYPRFIDFPGEDGILHRVDLEEQPKKEFQEEANGNTGINQYLLFTRRNPTTPQVLAINDETSILSSNFNARISTVVIVHGWCGNQNSGINPAIRDAYLRKSEANVIVLDWSRLAKSTYVTAVSGVPAVGRSLGQFLTFLNRITGAPFTSMHLVGFSLGAHVVGNAGRKLGGRVARVTGLDPAGPLWIGNPNRIQSNDGIYVEAIHTDSGILSLTDPVGDVDFYPNGGHFQPECITDLCNHNRAWQLFAVTINYNHLVGRQCNNMLEVLLDTCKGSTLGMGNDNLNKSGNGIFRLNTNGSYPY